MVSRKPWLQVFMLAMLALVAGCADGGTEPGSGLSDEQAEAITDEVIAASINAINSGSSAASSAILASIMGSSDGPAAAAAVPVPISISYSHTESCPLFGRIGVTGSVSGSIDSETGDGVLWLQVTETLTDCTFSSSNNDDLVINGSPSLTLTGNFSFLQGAPATQQSLTLSGGFRWDFDAGGSGFCALNLTFNLATAGSGGSTTVSGTVCGRQVNL